LQDSIRLRAKHRKFASDIQQVGSEPVVSEPFEMTNAVNTINIEKRGIQQLEAIAARAGMLKTS
jgi:hypothetical protein